MRIRKRKPKKRLLIILLIFILVLLNVTYLLMQPVIKRYAVSVAETVSLNCANRAIVNILEGGQVSYSDIVNLTNNGDGYVTSLEINVLEVNKLKGKISSEMNRLIQSGEKFDLRIPVGSFFGNIYTNGYGPDVKFKMQITTTCFVDFSHEFKSAGINQVLHIVNVDIKVRGSFIVAGFRQSINVTTSAIAAQTVIVGKSPDAFTNVIESTSDNTGGLINDYGAIAE